MHRGIWNFLNISVYYKRKQGVSVYYGHILLFFVNILFKILIWFTVFCIFGVIILYQIDNIVIQGSFTFVQDRQTKLKEKEEEYNKKQKISKELDAKLNQMREEKVIS